MTTVMVLMCGVTDIWVSGTDETGASVVCGTTGVWPAPEHAANPLQASARPQTRMDTKSPLTSGCAGSANDLRNYGS